MGFMERDVDINEISDGKLYSCNDMVKCGTNDCTGCSECCHFVEDTIILDPYDIYELTSATEKSFSELLDYGLIELHIQDRVMLPNIKMQKDNGGCAFLNSNGRCSIHSHRPGFCRLFPLGRIYENGSFSYFLQIHECDHLTGAKVKVRKWLGIPSIYEYEKFVLCWHDHLKDFRAELENASSDDLPKLLVTFLKHYFEKPYDVNRPFYEQFYDRLL